MPPDTDSPRPLRLRAADDEDLAIIAACLQDAIVMVGDMAYLSEDRRFVLVANRFLWEVAVKPGGEMARGFVGVVVEQVQGVKRRGIDPTRPQVLCALLSMNWTEQGLHLVFAGGGELLLETGTIDIRIEDLGESWPAGWRPQHEPGAS